MFKRGSVKTSRLLLLLAAVVALALAAGAALAQDKIMTLGGDGLKPFSRPRVNFTHETHSKMLSCFQCHHDFDKNWKSTYDSGSEASCGDCHVKKPKSAKDNPLPLADAYHKQCKSCHQVLAKKGDPKAPVTCGGCHVKGK